MCRWLAYRGKGIYLDELLYKPERSLVHQSLEAAKAVTAVNADGFGLCWYDNRDFPGTYHEVLPAWSDQNLRSLAHHINSHCFMAHVRASTGANTSRTNCHPFVYRDWAFMHNGQIGEFERVRYRLERSLPETLFLEKKGQTDSELIFLLMLKNGLTENPYEAMNQTVREIELAMQERGVKEPFKASMCISDGECFWGMRYSSHACPPPSLYYCELDDGIVLSSEPLQEDHSCWKPVPPQSLIKVYGNKHVELAKLK